MAKENLKGKDGVNDIANGINKKIGEVKKQFQKNFKTKGIGKDVIKLWLLALVFGILALVFSAGHSSTQSTENLAETKSMEDTSKPVEPEQTTEAPDKDDEISAKEETPKTEEKTTDKSEIHGEIAFGDILDQKKNCVDYDDNLKCAKTVVVLKAKITPSYNNKSTITQNYHNIGRYVETAGIDYDELQYWAVADMTDGSEQKVISFTVPKRTLTLLSEDKIATLQLDEGYITELWIHSSLTK